MLNRISIRILGAIVGICLLSACVPTGEGEWKPIPVDGTGTSQPAPARPTTAPTPTIVPTIAPIAEDETNIPGVREVHAVANEEDCDRMANTFRQQGRRIQLVRVKPIGGTILPWLCIFEGEDAATDVFQDNRSR